MDATNQVANLACNIGCVIKIIATHHDNYTWFARVIRPESPTCCRIASEANTGHIRLLTQEDADRQGLRFCLAAAAEKANLRFVGDKP